jgi:hypothetical protein
LDHFEYRDGELYAEDVPVSTLAGAYGTPLYVYSRATLERHWHAFDDALSGHRHLVCYAVKANSNLAVLQDLYRLMRKEMPEHARALRRLIEEPAAADREQRFREIGAILHKLQGVTCYAALPRLRKLLRQWPEQRRSGDEAVIGFCRQVIIELEAISDELDTVGAA